MRFIPGHLPAHCQKKYSDNIFSRRGTLLFVISLALLLFYSCEEEIDLDLATTKPRLVVDGLITDEYTRHSVKLSISDNYNTDADYPPASGASVLISDGKDDFHLKEISPGHYQTDSLGGKIGSAYQLEVFWQGTLYTARDSLTEVSDPNAPRLTMYDDRFEYEFRRHIFGLPKANRWALHVMPDMTSAAFDSTKFGQQVGIKVYSDGRREFNYYSHPSIEVSGLLNFEEGHFFGFFKGATIVLKKYSISDAYYSFLLGVLQETEWRGTLFDVIPANTNSNVDGEALGFFAASAVKEVRMRID